jgi:hypothetical protein
MAYQFDIDKIQDYIEQLCTRNKDVQHNQNGIKSFARFQSNEQVNELKKAAGKNIVVVGGIGGHRVGERDEKKLQREMILRFAVYAEKSGDVEGAKKDAIRKAEEIMLDFMTEMERQQENDFDNDDSCSIMHFLQPENFFWEEIEDQPWLLNHYGWDLTVPFKVYMPSHNPDKWT